MHLFAGAMQGIRNPKTHDNIHTSASRAVHHLYLASLLTSKAKDRDSRLFQKTVDLSGDGPRHLWWRIRSRLLRILSMPTQRAIMSALAPLCISLVLLLAACGGREPGACDGFADRELGITGEEYRPCALAILARLDSLRPRLQALVAGDVATNKEARAHFRELRTLLAETGIESDYRSMRSSTIIVKWPDGATRTFNSAALNAAVQYGAVLAFPDEDAFRQGVKTHDEARRAYNHIR